MGRGPDRNLTKNLIRRSGNTQFSTRVESIMTSSAIVRYQPVLGAKSPFVSDCHFLSSFLGTECDV